MVLHVVTSSWLLNCDFAIRGQPTSPPEPQQPHSLALTVNESSSYIPGLPLYECNNCPNGLSIHPCFSPLHLRFKSTTAAVLIV